jgi:SAM-dependent methyltransferase
LKKTARALEVGCGTGAIWTGAPFPARLYGVDLDLDRLREASVYAPEAILACADARHLPYAAGSFEATFCHFLLLWVPRPVEALREMARITRAGGYVIAFAEPNYKERVDRPAALAPLGGWQAESLLRQGADPDIGGRLPALFARAGISVIETGSLSKDPKRSLTPDEWQQEWAVLEADLGDSVPEKELGRLKRLDKQAWEQGTRLLSVPTYFAWGVVRQMV